jgi:hypothetical protein
MYSTSPFTIVLLFGDDFDAHSSTARLFNILDIGNYSVTPPPLEGRLVSFLGQTPYLHKPR